MWGVGAAGIQQSQLWALSRCGNKGAAGGCRALAWSEIIVPVLRTNGSFDAPFPRPELHTFSVLSLRSRVDLLFSFLPYVGTWLDARIPTQVERSLS